MPAREATSRFRRSEFPPAAEGEFYWADLLGCRVVGADGDESWERRGRSEREPGGQWIEVDDGSGSPRY